MGLISQSIKNLKSGISQQPDILRFPEQGEAQINGWSSETKGLMKRPPTIFDRAVDVSSSLGSKPLIHAINRDENEKYHIVFTGSSIRALTMTGVDVPVNIDAGMQSYITSPNPRDDLRMVTVADYTFITNTNVVVRSANAINDPGFNELNDALVYVKGGQYGRTFTVILNGNVGTFTTPDGVGEDGKEVAAMVKQTDAQFIVQKLIESLRQQVGLAGWTFGEGPGYIHCIAPNNGSITEITVRDGFAGQLASAVTHQVQSFSKLPLEAPHNYIVKVVGDTSKSTDAFYVRFDGRAKIWKEVLGWKSQARIDANTMPHVLIRQGDGSFRFTTYDWWDKTCGDDSTNPFPSFVDSTIRDIFFFRNRLGFLSGENIILSRTGGYSRFFPASVANLSDDDPIDVAVSHNRISVLKYAVPFSEQLLLWSDSAQFVLSASDSVLSAKSVSLDLSTEFDVSWRARPCGLGRGVYYTSPRAAYSTINRYYAVQDVSDVKNSEDITSHCPSYIENGVFSIQGSTTENYVSVLTEGAKNRIYMYKFLYLDETVRQQSWSHWEFPADVEILAATPIGSTLYILARNAVHFYACHVNFTKDTIDFVGEPYQLFMDLKTPYVIPASAYDADKYQTTFLFFEPYRMNIRFGTIMLVDSTGAAYYFKAPNADGSWPGDNPRITLDGDWSGKQVFIGRAIPFYYQFSKFLIKTTDQNGFVQTQDLGRLQLRRSWLNYVESGSFDVEVTNASRTFTYNMTGKKLGDRNMVLGNLNVATGQFRFPCPGEANSLTVAIRSEAPTALNVVGCGWEGNFINRAQGI